MAADVGRKVYNVITMNNSQRLGACISVGLFVAGCDDSRLSQQERVSRPEAGSTAAVGRDPQIVAQVKAAVAEILGSNTAKIKDGDEFMKDLGADSLDAVEIIMATEDTFGITIADEDAENMVTVGSLIDYVQARVVAGQQSRP